MLRRLRAKFIDAVLNLRQLGLKDIWAKANNQQHGRIYRPAKWSVLLRCIKSYKK